MDEVLTFLINGIDGLMNMIVFFSNDEIVFDVSDMDDSEQAVLLYNIEDDTMDIDVPLKLDLFMLHKIVGVDGYYKEIVNQYNYHRLEFKCLNSYMIPFIFRKFLGEEVTENDKVFYHEGLLSKFIDIPEIEVNVNGF